MRARVERDDGSVSSYSSSMTDTITAASMVLATTTGQHKDSNVTVTGTPALSFSSSGSFGVGTLRGSRSFTGTKVWEITPGALPAGGDFRMGLDSGSVSLNGSYYNAGETAGSDGAALVVQSNATWRIDFGGSAGGYTSRTHVSTDVYMIEHNTATGIARWYVTPSGGSRALLGTKTLGAGAMFPWFGTRDPGTTISVNFGQSAFAGVPTSGYTFP